MQSLLESLLVDPERPLVHGQCLVQLALRVQEESDVVEGDGLGVSYDPTWNLPGASLEASCSNALMSDE